MRGWASGRAAAGSPAARRHWLARRARWLAVAAAGCAVSTPGASAGFWEVLDDDYSVDLRALTRVNQLAARQPEVVGLPLDRRIDATNAALRFIAGATVDDRWSFELHATQFLQGGRLGFAPVSGVADGFAPTDRNRFSGLRWRWADNPATRAELAVDRLRVACSGDRTQVAVGRQPVNFATMYFFTPNDVLQPFAAQAFFRLYKPGVDAARVDVGLGDFTQLTLLGALGYRRGDQAAEIGDAVTWTESAVLVRAATTIASFEVSVLGGHAPRQYLVGGGLQGELFEWLGVRGEGHFARGDLEGPARDRARLALGIEHRFDNTMHPKLELFYNGGGATRPEDYPSVLSDPLFVTGAPYLGRYYLAAGVGYELHPLVTVEGLLLLNLADDSGQAAAYLAYAMLQDAELAAVLSVPFGRAPGLTGLRSELGSYPLAGSVEVRVYF